MRDMKKIPASIIMMKSSVMKIQSASYRHSDENSRPALTPRFEPNGLEKHIARIRQNICLVDH